MFGFSVVELPFLIGIIVVLAAVISLAFIVVRHFSKLAVGGADEAPCNTKADIDRIPSMRYDHPGLRFGPHGPWGPYL